MVAPVHRPLGESATSRHRQFANFLSVASSILGGAILQVFLSPPAAVTADASADPAAFGWCASLHSCAAWQRSWQISCVVAFCFVILSIIACATASIANKTSMSLAAAILFFFASFFATAAAVLSIVFLSFPKATCITTAALLVSLLLTSVLFGREGLVMGLDDVVLAPWLWRAAAAGDAAAVRRLLRWGASPTWGGHVPRGAAHDGDTTAYFLSDTGAIHGEGSMMVHHAIPCWCSGLMPSPCSAAHPANFPSTSQCCLHILAGVTPLHIAACHGHLEVAQELLRYSPDIKLAARDSLGSTALHVAAYSLNYEMLELFAAKSGDSWATNKGGWTPLLAAMGENQVSVCTIPEMTRTRAIPTSCMPIHAMQRLAFPAGPHQKTPSTLTKCGISILMVRRGLAFLVCYHQNACLLLVWQPCSLPVPAALLAAAALACHSTTC